MTQKYTLTAIATTALSLGMMGTAQAGTIIVPDSATASVPFESSSPITRTFDQSGLSVGYTEGDDFDAYLAGSPTHNSNPTTDARSLSGNPTGSITFDFGSVSTLESFGLWNFSGNNLLSIVDFSLEVSLTSDFSSSTSLGSFTATVPATLTPSSLEVFSFAPTNAQFIRLNVLTVNGGVGAPRFGIGEVIFEGSEVTETVPEPSSILGLLLMGGAGLLAKRQKSIK
ncbi:MAG: PEP-CTERM sorting domain-containing protein [Crocosphaera sp.]